MAGLAVAVTVADRRSRLLRAERDAAIRRVAVLEAFDPIQFMHYVGAPLGEEVDGIDARWPGTSVE